MSTQPQRLADSAWRACLGIAHGQRSCCSTKQLLFHRLARRFAGLEDLELHHIVVNDWERGVDAQQNVVLVSIASGEGLVRKHKSCKQGCAGQLTAHCACKQGLDEPHDGQQHVHQRQEGLALPRSPRRPAHMNPQ